jgi:malonyl-CoA/methylmalonyl-CoA synthetase
MSDPRPAIIAADGTFTYEQLDDASRRVASALLAGREDLDEDRVAFLVPPSFAYAATQRGIWRAGGVAVPLAVSHPPAELEYVIQDAGARIIVGDPVYAGTLGPLATQLGARLLMTGEALAAPPATELPHLGSNRRAMIIYTSGTTGRPKGVVSTHQTIGAQVSAAGGSLGLAAVGSPAAGPAVAPRARHHQRAGFGAGGACLQPRSCRPSTPRRCGIAVVRGSDRVHRGAHDLQPSHRIVGTRHTRRAARPFGQRARSSADDVRVAALPVHMLERWRQITGHTLLERYGMTEIGMALSNPLEGTRRPGTVGVPLPASTFTWWTKRDRGCRWATRRGRGTGSVRIPGVLAAAGGNEDRVPGTAGSARATWRWSRTASTGCSDAPAWTSSRPAASRCRRSRIEEVLRTHPAIAECAVVGTPDDEWGERVSTAVELRPGAELALDALQAWSKARWHRTRFRGP